MCGSTTNIGDSRQARARESKSRVTNRTPATIVDELRLAFKREANNILTIGDLLLQAKAKVDDANWLQWLKQEFAMSERSARKYIKYMRAAEFAREYELNADLTISLSALYLISENGHWELENGRRDATDAATKAARKEHVGRDRAP